jgi:two-component system CheB/CheR fusion protein
MSRKDGLNIVLRLPEGCENLVIKTDSIRIKQVLTNLLSNALKFTQSGKIEFGFEIINTEIRFFVVDTGIGIPSDKLDVIFNRFEQSEATILKKYGGTGLGLSISKGIVDLLGGNIWVESVLGEGSAFKFTIPYEKAIVKRAIGKKLNPATFRNIENRNVLIVEDDDIVFEFLRIVLTSVKVNLQRVDKGKSAIELYKQGNRFDLVLMDIGLPDIDGYKVIAAILKIDKKARIIAQTAYAMQEDIDKCYKAGCLDYISKPISPDLLISKMRNLID